jgi:hypothetical protein
MLSFKLSCSTGRCALADMRLIPIKETDGTVHPVTKLLPEPSSISAWSVFLRTTVALLRTCLRFTKLLFLFYCLYIIPHF